MNVIDTARANSRRRPAIIGICGAQGSGKTTLAGALTKRLAGLAQPAASLSIDDLYLTQAKRHKLARDVHPLLATRGVPGTHDIALGIAVFDGLAKGLATHLPRFDKACDDRAPYADWDLAPQDCEVLIFEGWCVGARPQSAQELVRPVNLLEAQEDAAGTWRHFANNALAGVYQELFGRIDKLVLLAAPDFDCVFDWRMQQESDLEASLAKDAPKTMNACQIARFIQHYERLTRHILSEMPARADLVVRLDQQRRPLEIQKRRVDQHRPE